MESVTDRWIDAHRNDILHDLRELLRIPSVNGAAEPGAPLGLNIKRALDYTLALCEKLGFATRDMDGMIGYADYGDGSETLGVLTHLDVVDVDDAWEHDPFSGEIYGDRIISRGVQDDKGPAIAAIYALAAIKETGLKMKRRVRLMFGCDEELGMRCLTYYLESGEKVPDISFSPDAEYPLVSSEMNICGATYKKAYASKISMEAGTAANAVPGRAVVTVPLTETEAKQALGGFALDGFKASYEPADEGCTITVLGAAAHASMPHLGKNALQAMLMLLNRLPLPPADLRAARELTDLFGMEYHGETIGLDSQDESGRLTLNPGVIKWDASGYTLHIDVRAPMSVGSATVSSKLDAAFVGKAERQSFNFSQGFYMAEDTELVSQLRSVYAKRSGTDLPPVHIGGGTYARDLPNAVAFGPQLPGKPDMCHMSDEYMTVEDFFFNVKTIADAITALATDRSN
ncbi:MAG: Sapep family Mn(2+)-dependent dipeptidase [Clostridiaceae bacterium]|nr:Sapep family Mn(2+)-dependent dipeptidase [Eubacteriales bacterium]